MSLQIVEKLLTVNEYSRGGRKLLGLKAIVLHWTANPNSTAEGDRNYFESRKDGKNGYGSAHYVVQDGMVIRCIPDDERAYHCGTSQIDPVSGKVYTDYARNKFGQYAIDHVHNSPNNVTIGIEMHPEDMAGNFSNLTWNTVVSLVTDLCMKFKLDPLEDITTHNQVVGWKNCPKLMTDKPEELIRFKNAVKALME
jgi:N-acetylmuramoyl-L-alanine amidase